MSWSDGNKKEITAGHDNQSSDGWLQIKSASYTGASYFYFLTRFEDGAYKYYRRDEFEEVAAEERTKYVRTLEGKAFTDSLQHR